jgi:hypothetical protein
LHHYASIVFGDFGLDERIALSLDVYLIVVRFKQFAISIPTATAWFAS